MAASELGMQSDLQNESCPICNAGLKGRSPEKAVRPLGHAGKGNTIKVGHRDEYLCGAVKLTNAHHPNGTIEANCVVPVSSVS